MRHFWWPFFLCFLRAESGEGKSEEIMTGTLGGSVTFHLRNSKEFTTVDWLIVIKDTAFKAATVAASPPCSVSVQLQKFQGRLTASGDCRNLIISDLDQDDSGTYSAQIEGKVQAFKLNVYKNLLENDLEFKCENHTFSGENHTLQLDCSVGTWEDGVNYTWTSSSKNEKIFSPIVQIQFQGNDMNYTCTAENPVSKASKTVSVKQVCEAARPTKEPVNDTEDATETGKPSNDIIYAVVPVVLAIVTAAACMGYYLWKKKKRAVHSMPSDPPGCSVPDESSKTIYSQIECPPAETKQTSTKKTQQQKERKAKDAVSTVYATVNPPKLTPLQTDDEKLEMESQEASEKTTKKATKPQEPDDPGIKTVYDTLGAPRSRDESEFHKLL